MEPRIRIRIIQLSTTLKNSRSIYRIWNARYSFYSSSQEGIKETLIDWLHPKKSSTSFPLLFVSFTDRFRRLGSCEHLGCSNLTCKKAMHYVGL